MKNKLPPIVNLAVAAIEDVKGLDIKVLDVHSMTAVTDHMVVCTGTSNRHVRSIAENVIARAKDKGHRPRGVEGINSGEWVLVDLVDVVVHVMQAQTRLFYQLEKLWDVPAPEAEKKPRPAAIRKSRPKAQPKAAARKRAKPRSAVKARGKPAARARPKARAKPRKRR